MPIEWDIPMVLLSVAIAIVGSLTALAHAQRMRASSGRTELIWMVVGATTLGTAIWSMHFIGLLAFHLQIPVGYDLTLTVVSGLPAIVAALLAFYVLRETNITVRRIVASSLLMGAGISVMHYTGMAAIRMSPPFSYHPLSVTASIVIAWVASLGALLMMCQGEKVKLPPVTRLILGGTMMGLAIAGMHYVSMVGLEFVPGSICLSYASGIGREVPAMMVSLVSLLWFFGGILAALFDQRMARQNAEALAELERTHLTLQGRTAELAEQEGLLRSITGAAQDAVILIDSAGLITYWNEAAERMFGYAAPEILGQNLHDLVTPERYLASHREGFSRFAESGTGPLIGKTRQIVAKRRGGAEFPIEISLSAVNLHGQWSAVGIVRDVTERVQAEELLQRKSAHLAEAQRLAHIGSWELDMLTGKLSWSDEIYRLFEIDQEQFGATYEAFLEAIHPDDRDAVNRAFSDSLAAGQPYEIVHRLRMSDGRIKWVHERGMSEYDAAGKPTRSSGTVQDITERKTHEADLGRFKAIVDSTDDAIISESMTGIITSWNRGAEKLFGYMAYETVGCQIQMLFAPDRLYEEDELLARISRGERVEHFETMRRHKDGYLIDISVTLSPILDEAGTVVGASKIARDITERKRMEEQIRQLAFYDPLTNLPNRRLLFDRCDQALRACARHKNHGAVLFIDLDRFKVLNDTKGHDVGDMLLIEVARRLLASVRAEDTVARMGGDEFVVLLCDLDSDTPTARVQAKAVAENIRGALDAPYVLGGHAHSSSPSIGVSLFKGSEVSVDELLAQADQAMYQAKAAGRNAIRVFGEHGRPVLEYP